MNNTNGNIESITGRPRSFHNGARSSCCNAPMIRIVYKYLEEVCAKCEQTADEAYMKAKISEEVSIAFQEATLEHLRRFPPKPLDYDKEVLEAFSNTKILPNGSQYLTATQLTEERAEHERDILTDFFRKMDELSYEALKQLQIMLLDTVKAKGEQDG